MELNQKTEQPFHQLWDFLEEKWDINKYEYVFINSDGQMRAPESTLIQSEGLF